MTRFIACVSAKGGVGKTTTAINLGIALNQFKRDVIIVDANTTTPSVGVSLGTPLVETGLYDALKNGAVEDIIHYHDSGTKVIPSQLDLKTREAVSFAQLKRLFTSLKGMTDIALFDCSAGVSKEVSFIMKLVDELLIVTTPDPTSVTAALKTVRMAEEMGKDIVGIVVTRKKGKLDLSKSEIEETMGYPVISSIPEDDFIRRAQHNQNAIISLYPRAPASIAYRNLAAVVVEEPYHERVPKDGMLKRVVKAIQNR